ncbi:hypothetical protein GGS21DRAFT_495877 [Xylaria nigripes]|nr:hypothetical protein GGS21DRAFT_495877 [Xylaria nigripes]
MMHSNTVFLATFTTCLARVIPFHPGQTRRELPGNDEVWTLDEVSRTIGDENELCKWHMAIERYPAAASSSVPPDPEGGTSNSTTLCDFEVKTSRGIDCSTEPFGRHQCSKNKHPFYVSGALVDDEYFVLTVEKTDEDRRALFGYFETLLDSGEIIPPQMSLVTHIDDATSDLVDRQDSGDDGPSSYEYQWTVAGMHRHIDTNASTWDMAFAIKTINEQAPFICNLHLDAPIGTDLRTWTWADKEMEGCGFIASWGYMAANDAGIMTLVNPSRDRIAWFGFDDINKSESLGWAGPNPSYPCNCGRHKY